MKGFRLWCSSGSARALLSSGLIPICMLVPVLFLWPGYVRCSPETAVVDWPLDASGSKWTQLNVPIGYGIVGLRDIRLTPRKEVILTVSKQMGVAAQKLDLWASWPTMEVPVPKTPAEAYLTAGTDTMWLGLQSGQEGLQFLKRTDLTMAENICNRPDYAKSNSDLTCRGGYSLVQKLSQFGLKHRGIENSNDESIYKAGHYNEIYYTPELDDRLTTFIRCSDKEDHPFEHEPNPASAACEQIFIVPFLNATARVGYRRESLKDWRSIQNAWIKQLQSFVLH